jgi:hypothetical protein
LPDAVSIAPTNIETAVQRTLAAYLRAALPDTVAVVRSLLPAAPEANRITVLPGSSPAAAVEPFIGQVDGRVWRDETFSVRVWVECLGDDLEDVEDAADELAVAVEEVIATLPDLGGLAGVIGFGGSMSRVTHPMSEIAAGTFYRWVDIEIEVKARYD